MNYFRLMPGLYRLRGMPSLLLRHLLVFVWSSHCGSVHHNAQTCETRPLPDKPPSLLQTAHLSKYRTADQDEFMFALEFQKQYLRERWANHIYGQPKLDSTRQRRGVLEASHVAQGQNLKGERIILHHIWKCGGTHLCELARESGFLAPLNSGCHRLVNDSALATNASAKWVPCAVGQGLASTEGMGTASEAPAVDRIDSTSSGAKGCQSGNDPAALSTSNPLLSSAEPSVSEESGVVHSPAEPQDLEIVDTSVQRPSPAALVADVCQEDTSREAVDTSCLPRQTVLLNIYDAGDVESVISPVTSGDPLLAGACHAGVEVFGSEWCFHNDEVSPSVLRVAPRAYPGHAYRTCVPKGCTRLSEAQVRDVLDRLEENWAGSKFDPVLHNSLRFCSVFCEALGVGRIATWEEQVARSPTALLGNASQAVAEGARQTDEAQWVANETFEALRRRSLEAIAIAKSSTEKITGAAQERTKQIAEHANVFGDAGLDRSQVLETVEFAQCETAKIMGVAQARGKLMAEAAHTQARAFGSGLWSWAADAQQAAARAFGDDRGGRKNRRGKVLRKGLVSMLPQHGTTNTESSRDAASSGHDIAEPSRNVAAASSERENPAPHVATDSATPRGEAAAGEAQPRVPKSNGYPAVAAPAASRSFVGEASDFDAE